MENNGNQPKKFRTFKGVYLPSALTILGVIMYLRMGWVVGNAGIWSTLLIISLASLITLLTGLCISAIATNMTVKGGGAYYMISRSFGAEAGSAIGIPLYFAQAIGIAFYIIGFTESLQLFIPTLSPLIISFSLLLILTIVAYFSTDLALRLQVIIFLMIIASLGSLFLGQPSTLPESQLPLPPPATFWAIFALFFPAVTGILSGVSLSGDLSNPRKSIPIGTLASVLTGFIIYIVISIFLYHRVPNNILRTDMMVLHKIAAIPFLILLGIWGATLSSALSSILGAPKTLQALAQDRILPAFLGKQVGHNAIPRNAIMVTFVIVAMVLLLRRIDNIAPILTMFLLATYCTLSLTAAIEAFLGNPSWRPIIRLPWLVPFVSFLLCLAIMILINPSATIAAALIIAFIYYITAKRRLNRRWHDIRHGLLLVLGRFSIYGLAKFAPNAKSWRPNLLVFSGSPTQRMDQILLADAMTHGKGFLTIASVIKRADPTPGRLNQLEDSFRQFLSNKNIPALIEINESDNFFNGAKELVRTYGMGALVPNTILIGDTHHQEHFIQYTDLIQYIHTCRKNIIIFKKGESDVHHNLGNKNILCWWRGKENNAGLMLTISYMLQTSPEWRGANLYIKTIVPHIESKEPTLKYLNEFLSSSRLIASPDVLVESEYNGNSGDIIHQQSQTADLVLLGLRVPEVDKTPEQYAHYYHHLLERIEGMPPTMLVLAGENINFKEIFD